MFKKLLIIFLLFSGSVLAQTPAVPCVTGPTQKFAKTTDSVTMSWTMPVEAAANLLYFRIRCSQAISGPFNVCYQVSPNVLNYTFVFNKTASFYYFVTAWYTEPQPSGADLILESEGSNMIRVRYQK